MTKRFATLLLCLLAAVTVGACQTIAEKRQIDYKATHTLPPLDIPPDLATPEGLKGATEPVPGTATYSGFVSEKNAQSQAPVSENVLPDFDNIQMKRDGQMRWLVVKMPADQVWPKIREFLLNSGFIINKENPQTGVIETDWSENHANVVTGVQKLLAKALGTLYSTGTRDKFRIRLEKGDTPDTTEIYLTDRSMVEKIVNQVGSQEVGQTRWEPGPSDPDLEAEMLRQLMVSMGVKEEKAKSVVAAAEAAPPAEHATLSHQGDSTMLTLPEDFERAWRRVGLALDRSSFTVEDRDRSKGIYYVRYIDPDKSQGGKGFFARLFGGKDKASMNEYQILVKGDETISRVDVLKKDGTPEKSATGVRILTLLYEQLK
ncbi:MAG: outer membrane protein assembly factor BamC [Sulfuricaulis sp.]